MAETEQNKNEEPTPFKLKRAREKGNVARGADIGFFAALSGLTLFLLIAGADTMINLQEAMRRVFAASISAAGDPQQAPALVGLIYQPAMHTVLLLGGIVVLIVGLFEIIQVRGIVFSSQPLKPDFSRLNPAKGLKRLFSVRMLKETAKSILKMAVYTAAAYLVTQHAFDTLGPTLVDAASLGKAMQAGGMNLLYAFVFLAMVFAAVDQVIVRREFLKQMRMSRSELTREIKEREGEPRIKRKRKELHAEFTKQTKAMGDLKGSDMLIVNPQHYAVGLAYDPRTMTAPRVTAKGRNRFALMLKGKAATLSIAIYEAPPLARALYKVCEKNQEVPPSQYQAVVDLYLKLARAGGFKRAVVHA
jgi:flagellar biosynthesis protein FlhB